MRLPAEPPECELSTIPATSQILGKLGRSVPHPGGWTAYVLSPDMKLPSAMRLKESRRIPMWNGPIECRLFRFDLVRGSARAAGSAPGSSDGEAG